MDLTPSQMEERIIGEMKNTPHEMKQVEWSIPDFFTVIENRLYNPCVSPTFCVFGKIWQLVLQLPNTTFDKCSLLLKSISKLESEYSIECYAGFKKANGNWTSLVYGVQKAGEISTFKITFVNHVALQQLKADVVPNDVLTVICLLKLQTEVNNSFQHAELCNTESLKLIRLEKLSQNLKDFLADEDSCDVILKVKDKEFKVHKSVLMARSNVFAANFKHDTLEKQTGVITIPDCDPDSFPKFLEYLYCGKLEDLTFPSALNLYYTSDKYDIQEVKEFCVKYLIQNLSIDNISDGAVLADKYEETLLFSAVQAFFNENVCKILETSEWEHLMKKDYRLANKLLKAMSKIKIKD